MDKTKFFVEVNDKTIIKNGQIQYAGNRFTVNHSAKKEYAYRLKKQNNNPNAYDIYDESGNYTHCVLWDNSITYTYDYGDGNILCLSYRRD